MLDELEHRLRFIVDSQGRLDRISSLIRQLKKFRDDRHLVGTEKDTCGDVIYHLYSAQQRLLELAQAIKETLPESIR